MSKTQTFSFYWIIGDNILDKPIASFLDCAIRDLIDSPCVLRETNCDERIYYAGNDHARHVCESKGKKTAWLHDFFNGVHGVLCSRGMRQKFGEFKKQNTNFLDLTARESLNLLKACNILNAEII